MVASTGRAVLVLLALVIPVYAATAVYDEASLNVDSEAAALTAWSLAERGTIDLTGVDADEHPRAARAIDRNPWIAEGENGTFGNRPVGLWAAAVPAYLTSTGDYRAWPATVTAIAMTAAAMAVVLVALCQAMPPAHALLGSAGLALLTATWPISSSQLWPHGPGQLLLAVGLLGLALRRRILAAAALAVAGLIRPVTVVMPGSIGLLRLRRARAWTAALGLASVGAVAVTVTYNWAVFGTPSISGGYGSGFRDNLLGQGATDYVTNLAGFFVSARHGIFVWTPVLIPAAIGAWRVWRDQPDWVRHSALAGLSYIVVHARLNRVSGGLPFDYRYPLEPLVLITPLAVQGLRSAMRASHPLRLAVLLTAGASLALQGLMAITAECVTPPGAAEAMCSLW